MRKTNSVLAFLSVFLFLGCSNKGELLPPFELKTLKGETISSQDTKGKVLVVNVWATWCGTCIKEVPALNRLYKHFETNEDVVFLAITDESVAKTTQSLKRFPFHYPQVADAENYTSGLQTRLVKTYPQNLVINREGVISFEVSDKSVDVYEDLKAAIEAAL